jgi:hypothetical protein
MTMRCTGAPLSTGRPAGLTMALSRGLLAGLLGPAAALGAGDPSLPERSLKVELRCAADAPASVLAPRTSDRVVGTSRAAPGVTVGTSQAAISGPAPMEVIVANGQAAALRWSGPEAAWDVVFDAAWTTAPAGRPSRTMQGGEPLLALRLVKRVHALGVQPHWPGGDRPVRLEVRLSRGEAATGAPALHTRVDVPLDRWTSLGRLLPPDAAAGNGGCALQLRVLLRP